MLRLKRKYLLLLLTGIYIIYLDKNTQELCFDVEDWLILIAALDAVCREDPHHLSPHISPPRVAPCLQTLTISGKSSPLLRITGFLFWND